MNRAERRFFIVVSSVISVLGIAGLVGAFQIYKIFGPSLITYSWWMLNVLFQTPILLIPLDRARTLNFVQRGFPQFVSLVMIAWNLTQIFLFLLSPVTLWLSGGTRWFNFFPFVVAATILIIVYRSAYNVVERNIKIRLKDLPHDWTPLTILHLSDVHSGPFMRSAHLKGIIERLNAKTFHLCVVTGDVVNHSSKDLKWTIPLLEEIRAPHGVYAAIGNHEYIDNEKEIIESYSKSKIELLLDSSKFIVVDQRKIRLIGVDFPFEKGITGPEEIERALMKSLRETPETEDELRVLLSHHPTGFDVAKNLSIPLTLAGHTHGGQIEIAKKSVISRFSKYIKGLYQEGESFMYVNSGLGNWLPFRINVPCEYALITIESE